MMRNSFFILLFFVSILSFISCQKEITYDLSLPSIGHLQCSRYEINDVTINGFSNIMMKVQVQRRGTFHIESIGTQNGIKLLGNGVFEEDGMQDVKLYAVGIPIYADTFIYQVIYNNDTCNIPIYFQKQDTTINAVMTLNGQPNTCAITPQDISGVYAVGVSMQPSNTVTIHVTVSTPGVYTIQTPYINGIRFSAQGTINTTGPYDIILQAEGIPITRNNNGAPFYYPVTVGSNSCAISMIFL